jgi:Flp pilus assembly pilin Flp
MKLFDLIKSFSKDESGAVTVDWVVLTAAIVALGMGVIFMVQDSVNGLGGKIAAAITDIEPEGD